MPETISLIKANPLLPAEDYTALRKQGFKAIEKLGSANWTDYNNSDPGITILEAVCYAITDLAYRTGFDIEDILAPEELEEDTWKQIFYTARQILHNNPLTLADYRKLLIDVKGVRNAWIEPSKDYEAPIWVDYNAWELRKEHDCFCKDQSEHVCVGRLRLDPVIQQQAEEENKATLKQIIERLQKLQDQVKPLQAKITSLKAQLEKESDVAAQLILKEQISELDRQNQSLLDEIQKLQGIINEHNVLHYTPSKILELEGLYNVILEYEEDVLDEHRREAVRQTAIERLLHHRNLCEDFLSVTAVEYEDFGIGASIELEEYADPDVVLAQIFFTIYKYFTPSIPFHTIDEMLAKGYLVDEIFEGPALKHGFIEDDDLEKTDLFRDIRLSDIINSVADINGIKGILYLHLPFAGFEQPDADKSYFDLWVNALRNARKIARIQPEKSQILFCKNRDFVSYFTGMPQDRRPDRMLKLFKDLKTQERKYKLENPQNDFPVPVGEHMQIEDYFPVTESLPMCYGVSKRVGLPGESESKLRTQVLQLKGYLLFFEQMLAGYLQQLNHLRDLFSFDDTVRHTYFAFDTREEYHAQSSNQQASGDKTKHYYVSKWLDEIDQLQALLIDHENYAAQGKGDADTFAHIRNTFIHTVQNLMETPELFGERRNRFLDHMLARFGEDLSEFERITRWLTPDDADTRLIGAKVNMLKDGEYYRISSKRGCSYNYAAADFWDAPNVSGTERRVGRLLGFSAIQRRTLAPDFLVSETVLETDPKTKQQTPKKNAKGQILNIIKFYDPDEKSTVLLTSVEVADGCCTEELMTEILKHADDRRNFQLKEDLKQRSRKSAGLIGTFWFELWDGTDPETAVLLGSSERFDKKEARDKIFHKLLKLMDAIDRNEGFHLVEHLLLRPRIDVEYDEADKQIEPAFLDICLDDCDIGIGLDDGTELPWYRKTIRRIPAEKCYDKLPWILEYFRYNEATQKFDQSILFRQVPLDGSVPERLKFRHYETLAQRVRDLQEFGAERINYEIVSNRETDPANVKYGFIIHGDGGKVLAQSLYIFNLKQPGQQGEVVDDIEVEIAQLMRYFEFELDLYCEANPCDNNEDPYSFRTTAVLPCWPKRFRDPTFRSLVEKTLQTEAPAHVHTRIVWLGIQEMHRFETAYSAWLLEMSQTELPAYEKTNPLVEVLNTLQPCGSCSDDCGAAH